MNEAGLDLLGAIILWAAALLTGAIIVYAIVSSVVSGRKFRAEVPALVRAAIALTDEQVTELSDELLWTYRCALEYAREYRGGALRGDTELEAAFERIVGERMRRIDRDGAIRRAEDIARSAAKAAQARRELGL